MASKLCITGFALAALFAPISGPALAQGDTDIVLGKYGSWEVKKRVNYQRTICFLGADVVNPFALGSGAEGTYVEFGGAKGKAIYHIRLSSKSFSQFANASSNQIEVRADGRALPMFNVKIAPMKSGGGSVSGFLGEIDGRKLLSAPFAAELRVAGRVQWSDNVSIPLEAAYKFDQCMMGLA